VNQKPELSSAVEKERLRDEINEQIEEFLHSGGQINVLTDTSKCTRFSSIGSTWNDPENFIEIAD